MRLNWILKCDRSTNASNCNLILIEELSWPSLNNQSNIKKRKAIAIYFVGAYIQWDSLHSICACQNCSVKWVCCGCGPRPLQKHKITTTTTAANYCNLKQYSIVRSWQSNPLNDFKSFSTSRTPKRTQLKIALAWAFSCVLLFGCWLFCVDRICNVQAHSPKRSHTS